MIQLLRYQLALHLRIPSTYVMLAFIAIAIGLVAESHADETAAMAAMISKSSLMVWVTLTFFLQMTAFYHFYFRPEALQYRLARLRSRHRLIVAALIHVVMLAVFATIPFAIIYFGKLDDPRIVMLSTLNTFVFYIYLGVATSLVVRLIGTGTSTSILLLFLLFLLPIGIDGVLNFMPSLANNDIVIWMVDLLRSHLDVSSNADTLIIRGIQDTAALLRTLILTPILATLTYVHFLRGDHH